MDLTTLTDALASAGISEDTEVFQFGLKSISLETDGNIDYSFLSKSLYFDTTNELLKIKEYFFKLASGQFFRAERTSASNYRIHKDLDGSFTVLSSSIFKKFRTPKVGDIAYTVSGAPLSIVATATITSIDTNNGTMVLSSDLSLSGNLLCYADGDSLEIDAGSIAAIEGDETSSSLLGNDSLLVVRKPVTELDFDTVVSFQSIESFIFNRYVTNESILLRNRK
jgi:hypothetical protein